jgi:hypothetical protein
MRPIQIIFTLVISMFILSAQAQSVTVKVTGVDGNTTVVKQASSSSSSSCDSPDFPAIKGGSRKDINFNDLNFVTVMPYKASSNETLYISAELELKDGTKEEVEMSKYIRFSGTADSGDFSLLVSEISMVEVVRKP